MNKIGLNKLKLYVKYEGEYALLFERWDDKKDQELISREEFRILESIENNLAMIRTGQYSPELVQQMKKELDLAKSQVTEEVYIYLESGKRFEKKLTRF